MSSRKIVKAQGFTGVAILTEHQRHQALYEWNDTRAEFPDACVHELFERQAARDPEAAAVLCKGRRVSYRELNEHANQVAHALLRREVGTETLVGVCMERSPEMVIALLEVWKAGGAYVPLDPGYPRERLDFMAREAGLNVFLTDKKCGNLIASARNAAICLDPDYTAIAQESTDNPGAAADASQLAYVMFTSGSTGEPKGVMIEHRGLVNYLWWAMRTYAVEGGGAAPVHSSIAYDSTVASLYPPLLAGGAIEILPEGAGVQSLLAALRREKNRCKVVITPAHLELLSLQMSANEMAGATKMLVVAGEALRAKRLSRWRDGAPATRLFNEYGPTEATVGCCAYEVRADDPREGGVPIGRPIANTQVYVLDSESQPMPPGVTGELCVGGVGVARGYLNRQELTREKFLADPFSGQIGSRLYRTGDLGRHREDGLLECLGRVDNQVKLRGYRVELGEIEATLAGFPGVRSCAVMAREDIPGNEQLVAYVIAQENEMQDANVLRKGLRQRLPEYMVPAHFIFLDSFPLTRNGKIDRKALPAPTSKNGSAGREFAAPQSETEKKLAAIWLELLAVKRIGIHDDFFELGGDSLLAVRAMVRIQEVFEVMPSMQDFFPSATIAGLAEALTGREECRDRLANLAPVQQEGNEHFFFWIGAGSQAASLSFYLGSNQPVFRVGVESRIVDGCKSPYRVEELAGHLVSAVREKQPRGPYHLGGFCQDAIFAIEVARQLMAAGEDVGLLALFEPLNPSQSSRAGIEIALRRMKIRVRLRLAELRRLRISEFPVYARRRWKNLRWLLIRNSWQITGHFQFLKRQSRSLELERVLFYAVNAYKPYPLACPTVIFGCKDCPVLSVGDPYFGWRELLTGLCETHEISGDHVGIFREPNVQTLAKRLKDCLEKTRNR